MHPSLLTAPASSLTQSSLARLSKDSGPLVCVRIAENPLHLYLLTAGKPFSFLGCCLGIALQMGREARAPCCVLFIENLGRAPGLCHIVCAEWGCAWLFQNNKPMFSSHQGRNFSHSLRSGVPFITLKVCHSKSHKGKPSPKKRFPTL